jgi:hypothetical protein
MVFHWFSVKLKSPLGLAKGVGDLGTGLHDADPELVRAIGALLLHADGVAGDLGALSAEPGDLLRVGHGGGQPPLLALLEVGLDLLDQRLRRLRVLELEHDLVDAEVRVAAVRVQVDPHLLALGPEGRPVHVLAAGADEVLLRQLDRSGVPRRHRGRPRAAGRRRPGSRASPHRAGEARP